MKIHSIAFDLDDTLLDTTRLLSPMASQAAFCILQDHGLKLGLDECEKLRQEWVKTISHKDFFKKLAIEYGTDKTLKSLDLANKAFYHPVIPSELPLLPEALNNLEILKSKYDLFLVTAGIEDAQMAKIKSLNISHFFKKIFIVDSFNQKRKFDAFSAILAENNIQPENLLCIGNSLSSEIKDARLIGAWACYFAFGEDRGSYPTDPLLQPHFTVSNHSELIKTCQI